MGGLTRFKAKNHPQQSAVRGTDPLIDDRATPPEWFAELQARFGFTVDAAASAHNCKLPRYFDKDADGLTQPWGGERVWCNPPFSTIEPWVKKAWLEHRKGAPLIVLLVPANRTEQSWWQNYIEPFRDQERWNMRVEFIAGRRRFIAAGNATVQANERPPFGVCLLIWKRP